MRRSAALKVCFVAGATAALGASLFLQLLRRLGSRPSTAAKPGLTPCGTPLPRVLHARLEPVKPGRLIVVGDLHGTPELFTLLDQLSYVPSHDNLVLAGDLVNKGPASLQLLDALPELEAAAVRGNHDDAVLGAWLTWRQEGTPLPSRLRWSRDLTPAHVELLTQLPFTLTVPQYGVVVVHAGLVPGVPLEQQDTWACLKMRNLVPHDSSPAHDAAATSGTPSAATTTTTNTVTVTSAVRAGARYTAVEKAKEGGQAWAPLWPGEPPAQHVFFGHDAKRRLQCTPHATGLDTGCVYGGELTAAVLPPLAELVGSSPGFVAAMRHGWPLTREDLKVQLVSVPAACVYSPPDGAEGTAAAGGSGSGSGGGGGSSGGQVVKEVGGAGTASRAGVELAHQASR